jgi:hypothetical protein
MKVPRKVSVSQDEPVSSELQRLSNLGDVIRLLRSEVTRAGSQREFARKAGVNVSVVSKTLRGLVLPSKKILNALNLHIVYLSKGRLRD